MSKDFLTLKDAANKLGSPSSTNMNFIHKDGAILSGADPTPLSSYSLFEFPADDDIIKPLSEVFSYDGVSNTITPSFDFQTISKEGIVQHSNIGAMFMDDYSSILLSLFNDYKNNYRVSFKYTVTAIGNSENSYNCLLTLFVSDSDNIMFLHILRSTDASNATIKIMLEDFYGNIIPIDHPVIYGGNLGVTNIFTIEYMSNKLYHINESNNLKALLWDFGNNAIPLNPIGLQIGGIQIGGADFNNPRMLVEYLTMDV